MRQMDETGKFPFLHESLNFEYFFSYFLTVGKVRCLTGEWNAGGLRITLSEKSIRLLWTIVSERLCEV